MLSKPASGALCFTSLKTTVQPTTPREFLKVAYTRLRAAEHLLGGRFHLDAQYLAGYSIECGLKALILQRTPLQRRQDMLKRLTAGARMHQFEVLLGKLRVHKISLPPELVKKLRRFPWSPALRYEWHNRPSGETKAALKTSRAVLQWVEGQVQ